MVLAPHGVDGVLQQVQQHLFDQDAVGRQARQIGRHVDGDRHAIALGGNFGQGQRLGQDLVHRDVALLGRLPAHEVAHPLDYRGGPLGLTGDLVEGFGDARVVHRCRAAGLHAPYQTGGVVADGGQRLVQLVRNRRGHLAHGHQPGGLLQLLLLLALALADRAQGRDVGGHQQLRHLAVHPADLLRAHLEPAVHIGNVDFLAHPGVGHRPAAEQGQMPVDVIAEQPVIVIVAEHQGGLRPGGRGLGGTGERHGRRRRGDHRHRGIELV